MKIILLWLFPLVAAVTRSPRNPSQATFAGPKSPLSRFDKKLIGVYNNAGNKSMSIGECYELVLKIYSRIGRWAIIFPPSLPTIQRLVQKDPVDSISRADFVNLARELKQSTFKWLFLWMSFPPLAMLFASQVPDEVWLSLDLWIVDLVHSFPPSQSWTVISSHEMISDVLMLCLALVLGNALVCVFNTVLWIGEGKDQSVIRPSLPKPQNRIPYEPPLEPQLVETHHHPEPTVDDVPQVANEVVENSNSFAAPLLVAAASTGVAAFSLPFVRHPSPTTRQTKQVSSLKGKATPNTSSADKGRTIAQPPKKIDKDESTPSEDASPKKEKSRVGRIAGGAAIVGCLQYAATVARFVGVLLP